MGTDHVKGIAFLLIRIEKESGKTAVSRDL